MVFDFKDYEIVFLIEDLYVFYGKFEVILEGDLQFECYKISVLIGLFGFGKLIYLCLLN